MNVPKIALVTLALLCLGSVSIVSASAQYPEFRSGASVEIGVPVDFNTLYQRADAIYEVVEHNDSQIVWKFKGTTGDWAFVFADGRIVVASTVKFDMATKDTLEKELNDVMDLINAAGGKITQESRTKALDDTVHYASEQGIYHRIKHEFNSNFVLTLMVPDCTIKNARLTILGEDADQTTFGQRIGQIYYIDGKNIASCDSTFYMSGETHPCSISPVEITDKIPAGLHTITADLIRRGHTLIIDAITSPMPPKEFVLYGPNYQPWINETTKSMDLQALQDILYKP